jgi:uncharacterized tellurite resistance protein B-like protein
MDFRKLLGLGGKERGRSPELGDLFTGISEIAADRPPEEIKRATGLAGLLGKVAYADMEIDADEVSRVREILERETGLPRSSVEAITALLEGHRVELLSVQDHHYARMIAEVADHGEKLEVLRAMFAVAAADGSVRQREDAEIRAVSRGLKLSHRDYISVRSEFRDRLAVLRKDC